MVKHLFLFLPIVVMLSSTVYSQEKEKLVEFYDVKYDTTADPFKDLQTAVAVAQKTDRNILLDVGGEWCIWCHRLDSLFRDNKDLAEYLKENYVPLKINFSKANKNEKFLSQFPEIPGYPHLFVLDSNGKLIHSQDTGQLEEGKKHSKAKVFAFLRQWSPKKDEMKGN